MLTAAQANAISTAAQSVMSNQDLPALLKALDDAYQKIEVAAKNGQKKVVIWPTQHVKGDMKIMLQGLGYSVTDETAGDITVSW